MLIVEKFGGSSLAGVERVRCAARLIADTVRAGHSVAAVLSAQGKTTDALLSTAAHYSPNPSRRELDMLLATGEQASVALMAMALEEKTGVNVPDDLMATFRTLNDLLAYLNEQGA